ncbi:iron complex transport system permease protein [Rubrivivax gelatinosus]|uniref:FecCD family ABC transporter permease n=2 Tax=Rubrivivax gelatinosus TaxID=28068 RepID=UPI001A353031|nr:iron ABC transporter permease [Rubrivivax gelatinosus]MBG6079727.1 iron complex transport system permease protein [Rubrivivax gelatinosus]
MRARRARHAMPLLAAALLVAAVLALSGGAAWVAPAQWLDGDGLMHDLVWVWRAPRVAAAFFVGACLALAGLLFQGVFRNPLAEPYLLGSASGAAVGAAVALLLPQWLPPGWSLPLLAFAGAWGASWLVLAVGRAGGGWQPARLLLAGVALAAILSALRGLLLMLFGDESTNLRALISWQLGGVQTPTAAQCAAFVPLLVLLAAGARRLAFGLDALGLGEQAAHGMGVRVPRLVAQAVLLAALATALAVCWGGLIGFVGLVVPHLLRWWLGPLHGRLVPACVLAGGMAMVLVDLIARAALAPSEIPAGLLTALVGGPFFLGLLLRRRE